MLGEFCAKNDKMGASILFNVLLLSNNNVFEIRMLSFVAMSNLQAWGALSNLEAFKQKTRPSTNKCKKQSKRPQLTGHFLNTLL